MKQDSNTKSVPTQFDLADDDLVELANKLIAKNHTHLASCKMAYLYKNKPMKLKGVEVAATAEKVPTKHRSLSGYHFIITIAYPTWQELDDKIRLAVLDHELEHCFVEDDEKTGEPKYSVLPHDVEEFSTIIRRHGLYTKDLVRIGHVVQDALESLNKNVVVKKLKPSEEAKEADDEESEEPSEEEEETKVKKHKKIKKHKKGKKVKKHHHEEEESDSDDLI